MQMPNGGNERKLEIKGIEGQQSKRQKCEPMEEKTSTKECKRDKWGIGKGEPKEGKRERERKNKREIKIKIK